MTIRSDRGISPGVRHAVTAGAVAVALLLFAEPEPAVAQLCSDVPHSADPTALDCASENERWAVIDGTTGLVTNVVVWNGTNLWRPPAGEFARDLPDGSPVGPGWWLVDGEFVRDSFERNVTARADVLSVHLSWSTGGLGLDSDAITFTVDVQPTGESITVSDTGLTIDQLEAGVVHTFTVTATRPDGSTVTGPIVTATPEADPDPDCTDHSVARECRRATDWAVVHPTTGMVENVTVCTPEQCGADGVWGGRMPDDTPWPGHLLIELPDESPAGIGWQYVDGVFVDVRPVEEDDESGEAENSDEVSEGQDRRWAVVEDATGMVLNTIVWDGSSPYDPGDGVTLVELTGSAGIGWQYVDGVFVDVRPTEEGPPESAMSEAPTPAEGLEDTGGVPTTDAPPGLGGISLLPAIPEGLAWGEDGLPSVAALIAARTSDG